MKKLLLCILFLLTIISLQAQNDCSELLQYGIYDHFNRSENVSGYSKMQSALQTIYTKYKKDNRNGRVKASYSLFSGGASYTGEQINSLYKLMNSSKTQETDFKKDISLIQSTINPHILNAYNECRKLSSSSGLKIEVSMSPGELSPISFDIYYAEKNLSQTTPIVKEIIAKSESGTNDCFELQATSTFKGGIKLNRLERYSLVFYRKKLLKPYKNPKGEIILAKAGIIKINTTMGNYTLWVPAVVQEKEVPKNVGEIVATMLTEQQFYTLHKRENWMLANGGKVGINTAYYKTTLKTRVPDLRGVFLRGKNHDRKPETGNSNGNLTLGDYEKDSIILHKHPILSNVFDAGTKRRNNINAWTGKSTHYGFGYGNDETSNNIKGTKETKPRSVTVNYFIRIN